MEQGRYWMWSKPTHDLNFHLQASTKTFYGDSWEEQAFAVDAAGSLGGCIWPPRSYTCSFCRREFRSAQALGGHMNVHRRDRARLKQSPNPLDHEVHQNHQNHLLNPSTPLDLQCPSHISTMVSNSNPNCFRVFPSLTLENCNEKSSFPLFASSTLVERHNNSSIFPLPSRSNLVAESYLHILDLKNEEKNLKLLGYESTIAKEDFVKTDLSISLNFIVRRSRSASSEGKIEEDKNSKRQKIDSTSLSSFSRTNSGDRYDLQSEVLELSSSSTEELDLELRLGDGQQVK